MIGLCVTFCGLPCRFLKCCFQSLILSCWFVAFKLALVVLFLLLTLFIVCHAILDCLSSTESLILSIWFCMYSVCSFREMLANSFCVIFSFRAFVFVEFFLYKDVCCSSKERIRIYFKIRRSTKRFVFFEFIYFGFIIVIYIYICVCVCVCVCVFPACCFCQRTYIYIYIYIYIIYISEVGNPIYPIPPLGQDMTQGQFL